jgi:hypothetical protein
MISVGSSAIFTRNTCDGGRGGQRTNQPEGRAEEEKRRVKRRGIEDRSQERRER